MTACGGPDVHNLLQCVCWHTNPRMLLSGIRTSGGSWVEPTDRIGIDELPLWLSLTLSLSPGMPTDSWEKMEETAIWKPDKKGPFLEHDQAEMLRWEFHFLRMHRLWHFVVAWATKEHSHCIYPPFIQRLTYLRNSKVLFKWKDEYVKRMVQNWLCSNKDNGFHHGQDPPV